MLCSELEARPDMGPNTEGRVIHELEIPVTPTERRELSGTLPPDTKRYN